MKNNDRDISEIETEIIQLLKIYNEHETTIENKRTIMIHLKNIDDENCYVSFVHHYTFKRSIFDRILKKEVIEESRRKLFSKFQTRV